MVVNEGFVCSKIIPDWFFATPTFWETLSLKGLLIISKVKPLYDDESGVSSWFVDIAFKSSKDWSKLFKFSAPHFIKKKSILFKISITFKIIADIKANIIDKVPI